MPRKPQKTPTPADLNAAANLRALWAQIKKQYGWTQEKLAEIYGAQTQGAISHYLTGRTPIGPVATLKFARIFDCRPTDIRPDFEFSITQGDLPQDVIEAAIKMATLPAAVRHDFAKLIDTMTSSNYPAFIDRMSTYRNSKIHDCATENK